ncbi:MtrAB system histidine kinase MtrB [Streptomyces sp. Je 1-4]|uniref:MtrAB system histidine kinase MtrB n=1 Tax=Streptomyces TaxID=1883 RepID=UPI0021DA1F2A|nr:MtrAB system histidine kinase MtrB [Streptomyces sp. Je 1-4]UYB42126.1 MtrAB system histidine kinase MtrB [Streptomyces sp. Je 1-4]UZQ38408.1 MtrAB system histidine kinase MtrB [Streptomyces sp. Je 1-4] [Streptomyces sp. Je 1-4 4N24]UZQ45825.1 MtrAB system histidine kinase MtrB [Streptomyces sp. Je 1-4] [Streptomyces sp. Je 1-4 4N24_ara]
MLRGGQLLPDGAVSGPVHPLLRLFSRWVRRPLLPALRLWRRNIQLRVVATTLLMSLAVVLLLGVVVVGQVRNGLLTAKDRAAQSQAVGGFSVAQKMADGADDTRPDEGARTGNRGSQDSATWLTGLVEQLASGGQGVFSVVALSSDSDEPFGDSSPGTRGPRASGDVDPERSVPADLRRKLDTKAGTFRQFTQIKRIGSDDGVSALIIGKRLNDVNSNQYQLYYLFPFTQEEESLKLVTGTLATAGVFVVILLGAIAWLVVRQVVTPVRMAAGISERLAAGLLQERMKVTGEDDIARLGESFNKMAQNLQVKIQQLEELSRMQRRFVSDVSHELRTPLTTVRMAADVIHDARDEFDPATARSAELLRGQLDRFESLLAELLEISRFDAGAAALEAEPVDLRDVVHRVIEGAEPLADRKGTRIVVRGAEQPVIAEADPRRVERVLRNLVVNAVEHGEGRDVVVRLASAGGRSGGAVAVAVRDYGVGLKPGEATRVFNRFWRADPARARTTGGTGLGLSIAVEDARLHGGWLQAWGEPGGGSQFRLTLPRTAGETLRGSPIPLEPEDSRRHRGLDEAGQPRTGSGHKASTIPVQTRAAQAGDSTSPVPEPKVARPEADPTALPGSGARVVPQSGGARSEAAARDEGARIDEPAREGGAEQEAGQGVEREGGLRGH